MASENQPTSCFLAQSSGSGFSSSSTTVNSPGSSSTPYSPSDMPPGGSRRGHRPKRDADLSSLLTGNEKNELVLLVARITEKMQQKIVQVFDSSGVGNAAERSPPSFWSKLPANLKDLSLRDRDKENEDPANAARGRGGGENGLQAGLDPGGAARGNESELVGLQELKKEALQSFRRWQTQVHRRVNDISVGNSRSNNRGQPSSRGRRGARGSGRDKGPRPPAQGHQTQPSQGNGSTVGRSDTRLGSAGADAALIQLYPPIPTTLFSLPMSKKTLLLHAMLLLLLSLEHYCAFSRVLLLNLASSLHIPLHILAEDEVRVAKSLSQLAKDVPNDEAVEKPSEENKASKRWKTGLAGAAGAAAMGVTGGLAAPLIAAGIGSVLGGIGLGSTAAAGLLGALAESTLVVGTLFGLCGARASIKMADQYTKEVQDFAFLPVHGALRKEYRDGKDVAPNDRRLKVVLGVSGWLAQKEDVVNPWRVLGHQSEVYALRWDLESLMRMGNSLETVVKSTAWTRTKKEIIARTTFSSLLQAVWPLGLLRISKIIDNPWSVGMVRADKAGTILADAIINKVQGDRGITLIGYSLGARAIYTCLMTLAEKRAFGLVENVVLMGTPAPSDAGVWCTLRSVVTGRLVNVYSESDYILGFLYRTSSIQYGVAGLQRIERTAGVENVDVSDKVSGHLRYQHLVGSILKHIGWEDIDSGQVAKDEKTLMLVEERIREREMKREAAELAVEAAELIKEVSKKNDQGRIQAAETRKPAKN